MFLSINMQKTRIILLAVWWGTCILAGAVVLAFETGLVVPGAWIGNARMEFMMSVAMELLTLVAIPLALWLFKWRRVNAALKKGKDRALCSWGLVRLLLLCLPLLANVFIYYLLMRPSFLYLAIIFFLCLFFVYPSMGRCIRETGDE